MWRRLRGLAAALIGCVALGCGGAYADAIARGDQFAASGMWDEAAAAYEEAKRIDPADPEASIKLAEARRAQAKDRLARAQALEQRGDLAAALALVQDAVRLDSTNTEVQRALSRVNDAVLDRAEQLVGQGKERDAFELTTLVLQGSPQHIRGKQLDEKIRAQLADQAFARAKTYAKAEKLGNALVELAACLTYRADYPDAKLEFGQLKLRLEEQLRFLVLLEPFQAPGKNAPVAQALKPELVAQSLDQKLLLKVVQTKPAPEAPGVDVRGAFEGYEFAHTQNRFDRSCDYQCGVQSQHNPKRDQVEQQLATLERDLSSAEDEMARIQKDIGTLEQEVARAEQELDQKTQELDRARSELDRCRASAQPGNSSACSSEDSRVRSAQSSVESARNRLSGPRSNLQSARDRLRSAQERRESARRSRDDKMQELRSTPEMIDVPKYCPFPYAVDQHRVGSRVTLKLTLTRLGEDKPIVADQPFPYETAQQDETRPGHPGRCPQVAAADPLELPSEDQLRQQLVTKVIKDLRSRIMAAYDTYRQKYLAEARRAESAGLSDEATEAYVRYVLTGPGALERKEQIAAFLRRTRGLGQLDSLWSL